MEVDYTLEKEDYGVISDILSEVIYPDQIEWTDEEILVAWDSIPENIKDIAVQWGVSDTVFRDEAFVFLRDASHE